MCYSLNSGTLDKILTAAHADGKNAAQRSAREAEEFPAMVLKGFPPLFKTMVTLLSHGEQKEFAETMQALHNYAENKSLQGQVVASAFHAGGKQLKCHN